MPFISQQNALILTSEEELQGWLNSVDRPLAFTNGCFDILHRGHVSYLQQAAALGSSLLVALNSDDSVRRQGKGEDRPLNQLEDRMAVIAALGCVDAVCSFDSDTPLELLTICQPDILVKGGDWPIESIVGCKQTQARGGQCYSIPFEFERSTTALLNRIREHQS
jgi:rfaE bifunctional protein nucleotidyltransferase chain/domain